MTHYGLLTNRAVIRLRVSVAHEDRARLLRAGGHAIEAERESQLAGRAYETAVSDLTRAVELRSQQPQAYANLADAFMHRGRLDAALPHLNRALELAPTAALYRNRSRLNTTRCDYTAALRDIEEAIRLASEKESDEQKADDQLLRGQLLFRLKKWNDALKAYDAALALAPGRAAAHQARGEALFELGQYVEAAVAMDWYQAKGAPQALASHARGLCRAKLGQYAGAIEDFTRVLEIDRAEGKPADATTLVQRGWADILLDAPKLAQRDFEAAVQLIGGHRADAFAGRGCARVVQGQWRLAVQDADAALKEEEPKARTLLTAARIHAQASACVLADPDWGADKQATAEVRDRYCAEALKLLRRAGELIPAADRAQFWAGTVHPDPALAAVRGTVEYQQMAETFSAKK